MEPGHPPIGPKRLKNIDRTSSLVNPACQTERPSTGTLPSVGRQLATHKGFPLMAQHTFRCMATWMVVMHFSDLRWCLGVQNGGYAAPRALRARY